MMLFAPTDVKEKNNTNAKPQAVLEKNNLLLDALSTRDRYEYSPDNLDDLCLAHFASSYIAKQL